MQETNNSENVKNGNSLEIVEKSNENKVPVIPIGLNLNNISMNEEKKEKDNKKFKTPMRKEVVKVGALNNILKVLEPIDFEHFAYGDKYQILENDYESVSDYETKNEIKSKLDDMKISFDGKIVIVVENMLSKSEDIGLSLGFLNNNIYLFNGDYWKELVYKPLIIEFLVMVAEASGLEPYKVRQSNARSRLLEEFISTCSIPENKSNEEIKINFKNGTYVFNNGKGKLREFRKDDYLFWYNRQIGCFF